MYLKHYKMQITAEYLQIFVQLIKNNQCLYNSKLQEYAKKEVTDKAWATIAKDMKWTVADCKERWKNIRNGFVRSIKPAAKGKKPYYLHEHMQFILPYIRPLQQFEYIENSDTETTTMMQPDENNDFQSQSTSTNGNVFTINNLDENSSESSSFKCKRTREMPPSNVMVNKNKKKKHLNDKEDYVSGAVLESIKEETDKEPNDDYRKMFLLSLLPDVENLSERNLRQFKIKSLLLLEEMLTEQEQSAEQFNDNSSQYVNYPTKTESLRSSESHCFENIDPSSPVDVKPSISPNEFF